MKNRAKSLRALLALCLALTLSASFAPAAGAAEVTASGDCSAAGSSVTWTLYDDGALVIAGSGAMSDNAPWSYYRSSIKTVTIESGVTRIGDSAFYSYQNLTDVTLPDGLESIGRWAFEYCEKLTAVEIPGSVTSVGIEAFSYCWELAYGKYGGADYLGNAENPYLVLLGAVDDLSLEAYPIHPDTKVIADNAFCNCRSATAFVIPEGVTDVGDFAFYYCDKMAGLTIPSSVRRIGASAFTNCEKLTAVTLPDGMTEIAPNTFQNCYELAAVTFGSGLTRIGDSAFSYCRKLAEIALPDGVTEIGNYAFQNCESMTGIALPDALTHVGDDAFSGCLSLPYAAYNGANYLGNEKKTHLVLVRAENTALTACELHPDARVVCGWAFCFCGKLERITIPSGVREIGSYAFHGCDALVDVSFAGTQEMWDKIVIGESNAALTGATLHLLTAEELFEQQLLAAAELEDDDAVRAAVRETDLELLRQALLSDGPAAAVLAALEDGMAATLTVTSELDAFDGDEVTVIGALLGDLSGETVTLRIGAPGSEHTLPASCKDTGAICFSMELDGVENAAELAVPVAVTLPVPDGVDPEKLMILHYDAEGKAEEIGPDGYVLFEKDEKPYVRFVLDHFSDFVLAEVKGGVPGDLNGDEKVNAKDITTLQRFVAGGYGVTLESAVADLNRDGKVNAKDITTLQRFVAGGYGVVLE